MIKTSNGHFKRRSGTRWVTHHLDALDAFLVNLSLLYWLPQQLDSR